MKKISLLLPIPLIFLYGYSSDNGKKTMHIPSKITVTSAAFKEGETIPAMYTCEGTNTSPELSWSSLPEQTRSIALIADDPDAPHETWVHWVAFNIPADIKLLPEGVSIKTIGGTEGLTSFGRTGYGGPCPPSGMHRYYFKIYALDTTLSLDDRADKEGVTHAMQGHILAEGQLMGRYQKSL